MSTNRKPTHRIKYEVKDAEGKTLRTLTVGALWQPEGNKPGRIHLDAIPVGFSGRLVFWPADDEKDAS